MSRGVCLAMAVMLWASLWLTPAARAEAPATQPGSALVDLLAMGDWGEGVPAQRAVADALATYAAGQRPKVTAMLLAGDNFYVKLPGGADDPQWKSLFENMYDPARLNFPFYAALGNHDYEGSKDLAELAYARLHPDSRWKLPARYYRVELPAVDPLVTVLMLDSNRQVILEPDWNAQTKWLDAELAKPRKTRWVICCAHHPLFSNGAAGQNGVLQRDWGRLFQKHRVDFYVCGHEHNLQHLEIDGWPTSFITCGGGGAHAHPMLNNKLGPFSKTMYGFVQMLFTRDDAVVKFIGTDGAAAHVFRRAGDGTVSVLKTTASDKGVGKPLELIQALYERIHGPATQPATAPSAPTTEP